MLFIEVISIVKFCPSLVEKSLSKILIRKSIRGIQRKRLTFNFI